MSCEVIILNKFELITVFIVVGIALGGLYFLFIGSGLATASYVEVSVSGDSIVPSEFRMPTQGSINVINEGVSRVEVEVLRNDKIIWRRFIYPSNSYMIKANRGNYVVRLAEG